MDPMRKSKLHSWLKQVQETQQEEISCSECFDQVSTFVDLEVADQPARDLLPQVGQHIQQCQVCRQEYELLLNLAKATAKGEEPSIEALRKATQTNNSMD